MPSQDNGQWPEYAVCARCGVALGQDYRESPLGLRFCSDCFDGAVQEKVRERAAEIYLRGRCSNCGASLINGYRLSKLGVIYCISCYENLRKSDDRAQADKQITRCDSPHNKLGRSRRNVVVGGILWVSLAVSHLLLFVDILFSSTSKSFLPHSGPFFKGLVCLDFLTLALFLASERILGSTLRLIWTLLIATGFIILIGWEMIGLIR